MHNIKTHTQFSLSSGIVFVFRTKVILINYSLAKLHIKPNTSIFLIFWFKKKMSIGTHLFFSLECLQPKLLHSASNLSECGVREKSQSFKSSFHYMSRLEITYVCASCVIMSDCLWECVDTWFLWWFCSKRRRHLLEIKRKQPTESQFGFFEFICLRAFAFICFADFRRKFLFYLIKKKTSSNSKMMCDLYAC